MKKAKTTLFALAVVAIVGGALAFKAKTFATFYCTATANGVCKTSLGANGQGNLTTAATIASVFYTTTSNPAACNSAVCTQQAKLVFEQ
ncbi:MAG: hypothetical protein P4L51_15170 [Puia sp.]|nr:hypothetical protein [Puia sp.]